MITVTPTMCASLSELLEQGKVAPHLTLRVVINEGDQLDLTLESPQPEDEVFQFRGRAVLAIDPDAGQRLHGQRLDVSS